MVTEQNNDSKSSTIVIVLPFVGYSIPEWRDTLIFVITLLRRLFKSGFLNSVVTFLLNLLSNVLEWSVSQILWQLASHNAFGQYLQTHLFVTYLLHKKLS